VVKERLTVNDPGVEPPSVVVATVAAIETTGSGDVQTGTKIRVTCLPPTTTRRLKIGRSAFDVEGSKTVAPSSTFENVVGSSW
jgi:hypothetical protein